MFLTSTVYDVAPEADQETVNPPVFTLLNVIVGVPGGFGVVKDVVFWTPETLGLSAFLGVTKTVYVVPGDKPVIEIGEEFAWFVFGYPEIDEAPILTSMSYTLIFASAYIIEAVVPVIVCAPKKKEGYP